VGWSAATAASISRRIFSNASAVVVVALAGELFQQRFNADQVRHDIHDRHIQGHGCYCDRAVTRTVTLR
jgi:hypothetical protein